jgi:hypothetical protein
LLLHYAWDLGSNPSGLAIVLFKVKLPLNSSEKVRENFLETKPKGMLQYGLKNFRVINSNRDIQKIRGWLGFFG